MLEYTQTNLCIICHFQPKGNLISIEIFINFSLNKFHILVRNFFLEPLNPLGMFSRAKTDANPTLQCEFTYLGFRYSIWTILDTFLGLYYKEAVYESNTCTFWSVKLKK